MGSTAASLGVLGFENHTNLEIIQADARYTLRHPVDLIQISTGQRYDFLLHAKTCEELRDLGKMDYYLQLESREQQFFHKHWALLRYSNTCGFQDVQRHSTRKSPTEKNPITLPPTIHGWLNYALKPLDPSANGGFPSAEEVTRRVFLNIQQIQGKYIYWPLGGNAWTEEKSESKFRHTSPDEPYLVSLYRNRNESSNWPNYDEAVKNGGVDPKTRTYPARIGEVIEIVLQQHGAYMEPGMKDEIPGVLATHPWHAHGAPFWDAGKSISTM